jgi:hypothetical protein
MEFKQIEGSYFGIAGLTTKNRLVAWGKNQFETCHVPATTVRRFSSAADHGVAIIGCYANCDLSTATPILSANDFQCFLNSYAAQDPWANCDGSTTAPLFTANDFQCFLNVYAAGCSAP